MERLTHQDLQNLIHRFNTLEMFLIRAGFLIRIPVMPPRQIPAPIAQIRPILRPCHRVRFANDQPQSQPQQPRPQQLRPRPRHQQRHQQQLQLRQQHWIQSRPLPPAPPPSPVNQQETQQRPPIPTPRPRMFIRRMVRMIRQHNN